MTTKRKSLKDTLRGDRRKEINKHVQDEYQVSPNNKKILLKAKQNKALNPFSSLNQEQLKASKATSKYTLVIASAGTGKTSTIVGRVAYLLSNGIAPEDIILLTFTNKAGKEMLSRLSSFFDEDIIERIFAGTFHSYGKKLLPKKMKLKKPSDIKLIASNIYYHHAKKCGLSVDMQHGALIDLHSLYLNKYASSIPFSEFLENEDGDIEQNAIDFAVEFIEMLETEKKKHNYVDFNDLLTLMVESFEGKDCSNLHVIVDEYQDTNTLQNVILKKMSNVNLFCVGDYDQSIYAFNGSNIEIIGLFTHNYSGAVVHTLTKNYRSLQPIISLAEKVIGVNPRLYPKNIEVMAKGVEIAPRLRRYQNMNEQYRGILKEISKNQDRFAYEDIAIIYRGNATGDELEILCLENNIPHSKKQSSSFFEAIDISFIISMYRLLRGRVDLVDFTNIFTLLNLRERIKMFYDNTSFIGNGNFYKGMNISNSPKEDDVPHKEFLNQSPSSSAFKYIDSKSLIYFEDVKRIVNQTHGKKTPMEILEIIFSSQIYKAVLGALVRKTMVYKKDFSEEEIESQIRRKHNIIKKIFLNNNDFVSLSRILSNSLKDNNEKSQGVSLLTVHASKGLEYKLVYMVDMIEDMFPNTKLMNSGGGGIEEERRLFYVGVTRAMLVLELSYSEVGKSGKTTVPSRFLEEAGLMNIKPTV